MTEVEQQPQKLVGASLARVEDARFVSGLGRYLDDLTPSGTLHVRLVRSQYASADVDRVVIGEHEVPPEGTLFFTGQETGDLGIRADTRHQSWQSSLQPVLAQGCVRYVGEPVAAVLHPDPYVVEDAAEQVSVDYTPHAPIVDIPQALDPGARRVHQQWRDNMFVRRHRFFGDIDTARAQAHRTVRLALRSRRQAGVPLENRGCLAVPEAGGNGLTLWSSTQMPHLVRTYVAVQLGLPEHAVHVIAPDVGGGFGVKGQVFGEEVLTAWLALQTARPVKWVEDRSEHLQASIHARDAAYQMEAFVSRSGKVLGLRAQIAVDAGAYSVFPWTAGSDSGMASKVWLGPYAIENYEVEDIAVATNKCPVGTYRGVGRPGAVFSIERLMDQIASELDLDRLQVRRRNLVGSFPYTTANGLEYDSGSYLESMELAAEKIGYTDLVQQRPHPRGARFRTGVGIAVYNEQTAHGTTDFEVRGTPIETGYESVHIRVEPDGAVVVFTGLQSHGQSMETTFAQVVAQEMGVEFGSVTVRHGDTSNSPYCVGTWGSRGAALGGGAAARAAREIKAKIIRVAAHMLGVPAEQVEVAGGRARSLQEPDRCVSVAEVAYAANRHTALLPQDLAPGLAATVFLDGPFRGVFSNSAHAVAVEVDTVSGAVRLMRYVVVEDCGTCINPMVVEGQVHGGVAQGIGSALLEEIPYSAQGQPLATTFMDYLMPTATDVPHIEISHLESPSPLTELGIKGMGEAGAIGPMAAVTNAVSHALGTPVLDTPLRPERVWSYARAQVDPALRWQEATGVPVLGEFWAAPAKPNTARTEDAART